MTLRANQLAGLAAAIAEVRPLSAPADVMLYRFFRARHSIGKADRAIIADGVYAYLRRKRSLEAQVASDNPHQLALAVAVRELGHSIRELGAVVSATDAQWLADFKARGSLELAPAVAADVPSAPFKPAKISSRSRCCCSKRSSASIGPPPALPPAAGGPPR